MCPAVGATDTATFGRRRTAPLDSTGTVRSPAARFDSSAQPAGPGYNVVFLPFDANGPTGDYEVFADGFAVDTSKLPDSAVHRPVGLAHGSLYISDDKGGRVWRVVYRRGRP